MAAVERKAAAAEQLERKVEEVREHHLRDLSELAEATEAADLLRNQLVREKVARRLEHAVDDVRDTVGQFWDSLSRRANGNATAKSLASPSTLGMAADLQLPERVARSMVPYDVLAREEDYFVFDFAQPDDILTRHAGLLAVRSQESTYAVGHYATWGLDWGEFDDGDLLELTARLGGKAPSLRCLEEHPGVCIAELPDQEQPVQALDLTGRVGLVDGARLQLSRPTDPGFGCQARYDHFEIQRHLLHGEGLCRERNPEVGDYVLVQDGRFVGVVVWTDESRFKCAVLRRTFSSDFSFAIDMNLSPVSPETVKAFLEARKVVKAELLKIKKEYED